MLSKKDFLGGSKTTWFRSLTLSEWFCDICGRWFSGKSQYIYHMKCHDECCIETFVYPKLLVPCPITMARTPICVLCTGFNFSKNKCGREAHSALMYHYLFKHAGDIWKIGLDEDWLMRDLLLLLFGEAAS